MECSPLLDMFLCSALSPACVDNDLSGKKSLLAKKIVNKISRKCHFWLECVTTFGDKPEVGMNFRQGTRVV